MILPVWIIAVIAVLFLLRAAADLLIPIVIAILVSYALEPLVASLARRRVPRWASAGALLLLLVGGSGWGAYTLRDDVQQAVGALPELARRAREMLWSEKTSGAAGAVRQAAEAIQGRTGTAPGEGAASGQGGPALNAVVGFVQQGIGSVLTLVGNITVIAFLVFFLLLSGDHFRRRILEIAGRHLESRRVTASIIDDINAQIQRFLLVRALTGAVVAAATWLVLRWMGVGQAAIWGILAGIFNSIPYLGPLIVTGGLGVVVFIQFDDLLTTAYICGITLAITSLEGWLLTPALMSRAAQMNPVAIFVGLLFWSWVWGVWGTILAVPMMMTAKAICDRIEDLQPVGELLGE